MHSIILLNLSAKALHYLHCDDTSGFFFALRLAGVIITFSPGVQSSHWNLMSQWALIIGEQKPNLDCPQMGNQRVTRMRVWQPVGSFDFSSCNRRWQFFHPFSLSPNLTVQCVPIMTIFTVSNKLGTLERNGELARERILRLWWLKVLCSGFA